MSTAPNMATITAALERSLQNCSLSQHHHHHHHRHHQADSHGGLGNSSSSSIEIAQQNHHLQPNSSETTLELNSHMSLPYHWEQCLDLKTGEIYYINWRNGMKAKEDPRSTTEYSEDYYTEDDEDDSSYDSEESSTESSTTREPTKKSSNSHHKNNSAMEAQEEEEEEVEEEEEEVEDHVLVVAGCKSCLMYFMVPKHLEDCPKCTGQLLHFDRSENDIP